MRRGEIYWYDPGHTTGSEQSGRRPVLVIQNDLGNVSSPTTIVAALTTSRTKKDYPFHVSVEPADSGLSQPGIILLEQIQTVSQSKLRKLAGKCTPDIMQKVDAAIKKSLGLD